MRSGAGNLNSGGVEILEPQPQKVNYSGPAADNDGAVGPLKGHPPKPPYIR